LKASNDSAMLAHNAVRRQFNEKVPASGNAQNVAMYLLVERTSLQRHPV
jgi:hypothetical protein